METTFLQLNEGWNADPNDPNPVIEVQGPDLVLRFFVNHFQFPNFREGEVGVLRFLECERYRLGPTNDEGWYNKQCRFSTLAPAWGEFYLIEGAEFVANSPQDWRLCGGSDSSKMKHFLFYFRDNTFECVASDSIIEKSSDNSLLSLAPLNSVLSIKLSTHEAQRLDALMTEPVEVNEAFIRSLRRASLADRVSPKLQWDECP